MRSRVLVRRWSLAIASAVALLAVTPPAASAQRYSSLTFFGDSFTDMGMADLLAAFGGIPDPTPTPPYAPGTFTNGPTWAAYFAQLLGHPADAAPALAGGNNFAIGGARTGLLGTGGYPIGMLTQLALFNGSTPIPGLPPLGPRPVDPTGLYVVWGGVNDIRDAAELPAAQQLPAVQNAVSNVAFITGKLAKAGANTLLVPLAANSGLAPEVAGSPLAGIRSDLTDVFNGLLTGALGNLQSMFPLVHFATFDPNALYAAIAADAITGGSRFGITNLTDPCLPGFAMASPPISCNISLFADGLHPTTRAQAILAQFAAGAVVPEPATVTLVGVGLLTLGASRRRRVRRG